MKLLLMFFGIAIAMQGTSQTQADTKDDKGKIKIQAEFHELRSTHGNFFTGQSVSMYKILNNHLEIGAGVEHSYAPYHDDNGWKLYKLRFVPIYGDVKYKFLSSRIVSPFVYASVGWSFINYDKKPDAVTKIYHLSEQGLYAFGGIGTDIALTQHWGLQVKAGIKNFHLSGYDLEVNPHGVAGTVGLHYTL